MDIGYETTGNVFDIQRYSIHDGPGIRTIVFLKGCPLKCKWCCNPESQILQPVVMFKEDNCIHCGECIKACPKGAISLDNLNFIDRNLCNGCGECANVCLTGALTMKGEELTVQEIIKELKKDAITYRRSGGGITLSGGEPLLQHKFSIEILKACKSQGWSTAIETTGYTEDLHVLEEILPYLDLVLFDIKSIDNDIHKKYTGVSNELILKNALTVSKLAKKMVVRIPTIKGVNASVKGMQKICDFVKTLNNIKTIHILPYHTYGANKYKLLGREYPMGEIETLTQEEINNFEDIIKKNGFRCIIGG